MKSSKYLTIVGLDDSIIIYLAWLVRFYIEGLKACAAEAVPKWCYFNSTAKRPTIRKSVRQLAMVDLLTKADGGSIGWKILTTVWAYIWCMLPD